MTDPNARRTIYRYEVPVDDRWHDVKFTGDILYVAARRHDVVDFWAATSPDGATRVRRLRVFGTGQPMDASYEHRGTALAAGGSLVWHLMEVPDGG